MTKAKPRDKNGFPLAAPPAEKRGAIRPAFAAKKPRAAGTPKAAVALLVAQNGGPHEVAVRLDLKSPGIVYDWTDPARDNEISYARAAALSGPRATAAADYLAQRCGGVFVPLGQGDARGLPPLLAEAAREHGEAMAALLDALSDGRIDAREAARGIAQVNEAMQAWAALRGLLQGVVDAAAGAGGGA